jgi:hypothetical protein
MVDMEQAKGSTSESGASTTSESFKIAEDDLEELEALTSQILSSYQAQTHRALFTIYQRQKHIINRIRGYFEE